MPTESKLFSLAALKSVIKRKTSFVFCVYTSRVILVIVVLRWLHFASKSLLRARKTGTHEMHDTGPITVWCHPFKVRVRVKGRGLMYKVTGERV